MQKANYFCAALLLLALLVFAVPRVHAGHADGTARARAATVMCGGNNFTRLGGTQVHRAVYTLRNYDPARSITIDRIRFFDATGAVLYDSVGDGFPPFGNGVLSSTDRTQDPNQSAQLSSNSVLEELDSTKRPVQLRIDWSATRRALLLETVMVRQVRDADSAEISRHAYECRTIRR